MELPINDKELATIVSALRLGGDAALYQKLTRIKERAAVAHCRSGPYHGKAEATPSRWIARPSGKPPGSSAGSGSGCCG